MTKRVSCPKIPTKLPVYIHPLLSFDLQTNLYFLSFMEKCNSCIVSFLIKTSNDELQITENWSVI